MYFRQSSTIGGITFVIFSADSPLNQVVINYRRETTETLGIAANFMLLFPGYRFATPEETPEYVDGLARRLWGMRESFFGVAKSGVGIGG